MNEVEQQPENDQVASNLGDLQMHMRRQYTSKMCRPRRRVRIQLNFPYNIAERSRTKSETLDPNSLLYLEAVGAIPVASTSQTTLMETSDHSAAAQQMDTGIPGTSFSSSRTRPSKGKELVKSKSLEDLVRAVRAVDGSQPSHEMEFVSSRIQKLKVQE
ncbi:uncharacterized protein LOC129755764 [Uranotaenia lowii]|uniref:uncharacterized protein LOC129755764 n=1 Tax=Uranotaenia lowii TaxID=190385 RepID=UPI002479CDC8|nr:uncharacterized protein LOC129755764 [Uranotaenia lowii]XP_055608378.1 uncharacterized protein LOC129755764 [Uranotaenia lowii]